MFHLISLVFYTFRSPAKSYAIDEKDLILFILLNVYFEFILIHHQSLNDLTVIQLFKIDFIYYDLETNRFK